MFPDNSFCNLRAEWTGLMESEGCGLIGQVISFKLRTNFTIGYKARLLGNNQTGLLLHIYKRLEIEQNATYNLCFIWRWATDFTILKIQIPGTGYRIKNSGSGMAKANTFLNKKQRL